MIEQLVRSEIWKNTQERLSKVFNVPIRIIDTSGKELLATGKFPFLYDILRNKHMHLFENELASVKEDFICIAGLNHQLDQISISNTVQGAIIVGPFKTEPVYSKMAELSNKTGIDEEDLIEEYNEIPVSFPPKDLSKILSKIFHVISSNDLKHVQKINELMYSERLSKIFASKSIDSAFSDLAQFLVSLFNLKNCIINVYTFDKQYFHTNHHYPSEIMSRLDRLCRQARYVYQIPSLKGDLLFSNFKSAGKFSESFVIIPVNSADSHLASIMLISDSYNYSRENYDFFNFLSMRVMSYIHSMLHLKGVQETAITDNLTGIYNRYYFDTEFPKLISSCREKESAVSLILMDLDDFKFFNDTYGHSKGDFILKELGSIIRSVVRTSDVPCRYGGEEFAIILPDTNSDNAKVVAERLRSAVEDNMPSGFEKKITISLGVATCLNSSVSVSQMIKESDSALYKAKRNGKNRAEFVLIIDKSLDSIDVNDANRLYTNR